MHAFDRRADRILIVIPRMKSVQRGNNTATKDPTTPQVCRYTTLWNVKCLKNNNWKQDDFCNNTFKEINDREQRVYYLSYCLQ